MTSNETFHGLLDRSPGAMGVFEARIAEVRRNYAGRPEAEVFEALQHVHDDMGPHLDPVRGAELAKQIAESKPGAEADGSV